MAVSVCGMEVDVPAWIHGGSGDCIKTIGEKFLRRGQKSSNSICFDYQRRVFLDRI